MKNFWRWIGRISGLSGIISIIVSFVKGWWNMSGIKLFWDNLTPGTLMLYLILIFILISLVAYILGSVKFIIPRFFKLKFGIYWDKENNPYCPICKKTPLHGANYSNLLRCPKCDKEFGLRYGSKIYSLEEAVEDIKKGVV